MDDTSFTNRKNFKISYNEVKATYPSKEEIEVKKKELEETQCLRWDNTVDGNDNHSRSTYRSNPVIPQHKLKYDPSRGTDEEYSRKMEYKFAKKEKNEEYMSVKMKIKGGGGGDTGSVITNENNMNSENCNYYTNNSSYNNNNNVNNQNHYNNSSVLSVASSNNSDGIFKGNQVYSKDDLKIRSTRPQGAFPEKNAKRLIRPATAGSVRSTSSSTKQSGTGTEKSSNLSILHKGGRRHKKKLKGMIESFFIGDNLTMRKRINLKEFQLKSGVKVTNGVLQQVCIVIPHLEGLIVDDCKDVGDIGLWAIARHCPMLAEIRMARNEEITDHGLRSLALTTRNLRILDLTECIHLNNDHLRALASGCFTLEELILKGCTGISDLGLAEIALVCGNLITLDVSGCKKLGDSGDMAFIQLGQNCPKLQNLIMIGCKRIQDDGLKAITKKCDLRKLRLSGCDSLTSIAIRSIGKYCPLLVELELQRCKKLGNHDLEVLGLGCPKVEYLDLSVCNGISYTGVYQILKHMKNLNTLKLNSCMNLDDRIGTIIVRLARNLKSISLRNCPLISPVCLRLLSTNCKNLDYVDVTGSKKINIKFLIELVTKMPFHILSKANFGYEPHPEMEKKIREYKEKMKSLLAITLIQKIARGFLGKRKFRRAYENWVILTILPKLQGMARRFIVRRHLEKLRFKQYRINCAYKIQATWWGFVTRRKYSNVIAENKRYGSYVKLAIKVACAYRRYKAMKRVHMVRGQQAQVLLKEAKIRATRELYATKIQVMVRGKLGRNFANNLFVEREEKRAVDRKIYKEACRLQGIVRIFLVHCEIKRKKAKREFELFQWKMAREIQRVFRGYKGKLITIAMLKEKQADFMVAVACCIQRYYRGSRGRYIAIVQRYRLKLLKMMHIAATLFQKIYRGKAGREFARHVKLEKKKNAIIRKAAVNIQRMFLGHQGRTKYEICLMQKFNMNKAQPLIQRKNKLEVQIEGAEKSLKRLKERFEYCKEDMHIFEAEIRMMKNVKSLYWDTDRITGIPQRYIKKYLEAKIIEIRDENLIKLHVLEKEYKDQEAYCRSIHGGMRRLSREIIPLMKGTAETVKRDRIHRLRTTVRKQKWASIMIQKVARSYLTRCAINSWYRDYWIECREETTNDLYYYNTWSEENRINKPLEMYICEHLQGVYNEPGDNLSVESKGTVYTEKTDNHDPLAIKTNSKNMIQKAWISDTDPITGYKFYFNNLISEYRWTWPKDVQNKFYDSAWFSRQPKKKLFYESDIVKSIGLWNEMKHKKLECIYYFCPVADQFRYSLSPRSANLRADELVNLNPEGSERGKWIKIKDEISGQFYFYNKDTKRSQWEEPLGFIDMEESPGNPSIQLPSLEIMKIKHGKKIEKSVLGMQTNSRPIWLSAKEEKEARERMELRDKEAEKQRQIEEGIVEHFYKLSTIKVGDGEFAEDMNQRNIAQRVLREARQLEKQKARDAARDAAADLNIATDVHSNLTNDEATYIGNWVENIFVDNNNDNDNDSHSHTHSSGKTKNLYYKKESQQTRTEIQAILEGLTDKIVSTSLSSLSNEQDVDDSNIDEVVSGKGHKASCLKSPFEAPFIQAPPPVQRSLIDSVVPTKKDIFKYLGIDETHYKPEDGEEVDNIEAEVGDSVDKDFNVVDDNNNHNVDIKETIPLDDNGDENQQNDYKNDINKNSDDNSDNNNDSVSNSDDNKTPLKKAKSRVKQLIETLYPEDYIQEKKWEESDLVNKADAWKKQTNNATATNNDNNENNKEWTTYYDEEGYEYYYNIETGDSQYEIPEGYDNYYTLNDAHDDDIDYNGQGGEIVNDEDNYYGETTNANADQTYNTTRYNNIEFEGTEWQIYQDEKGYDYYYNINTGESQYELPQEFVTTDTNNDIEEDREESIHNNNSGEGKGDDDNIFASG